jgi:gliding motility-associated-like protein
MVIDFSDSSLGFVTSWFWNFGDGGTSTLQNPSHTYQSGGVYSVTLIVTNAGGCTDTLRLDSIIVVPFAVGDFSFSPAIGCNPLTVCFNVNAQNTSSYIWDFGDGTVLTSNGDTCHTYTSPGTFNPILLLSYTLPTGVSCVQQATNLTGSINVTNVINASINGPFVVTVPQDSIISISVTYTGGTAPYTYQWSPSIGINCSTCSNILIVGTGDTLVYTFTVYDSLGCIGVDSIIVLSAPCFEEKLIPNVFTPNGDGHNDIFYIPGICASEHYSLQIFNRWGMLIFSTTLRNNGWDGRNNSGVEVASGTYYYVITLSNLKDISGNPRKDEVHKGFITLIR